MKFIKEAWNYYKELKRKDHEKEKLLTAKLNYILLEELITKCSNNPGLVIEINLRTGDKLLLKTKEPQYSKPISSYIDGREVIE